MYLGNKHKEQFTPVHWNEGYISKYLQKKNKKEQQVHRFFSNTELFSKQDTLDYFSHPKMWSVEVELKKNCIPPFFFIFESPKHITFDLFYWRTWSSMWPEKL